MTQEEMKTIFEELVKSGVVLHAQCNSSFEKSNYIPGSRYNVRYIKDRRLCRVTSSDGRNCGLYSMKQEFQKQIKEENYDGI